MGPSSHFIYPNSNVRALGPVSVMKVGNVSVNVPQLRSGEHDLEIYKEALAQVPEANMIIDYYKITTATMIPLPWVSLFFTTTKFEGTAAKVEVGEQNIGQGKAQPPAQKAVQPPAKADERAEGTPKSAM